MCSSSETQLKFEMSNAQLRDLTSFQWSLAQNTTIFLNVSTFALNFKHAFPHPHTHTRTLTHPKHQ